VNLDIGDFRFAGDDWQGEPLKERKIDVNADGLGFEPGEAIGDANEPLPQAPQVLQTFIQSKFFHPVDTDSDTQEDREARPPSFQMEIYRCLRQASSRLRPLSRH
jgi:hypothetical protein